MKKLKQLFLMWLILLGTTVFANDALPPARFSTWVSGFFYTTAYQAVSKDVGGAYSAYRVKPVLEYVNESTQVVIAFEIDQLFGDSATGTKTTEEAGIGTKKIAMELRHSYIKVRPTYLKNLSLTGGVALYGFPLVFEDNVPIFRVDYDFGMGTASLGLIKTFEGDLLVQNDDSQIYLLDLTFKAGKHSIRPAVFFYQSGKNSTRDSGVYKDSTGIIGALALNFSFGEVTVDLSGAYTFSGQNKNTSVNYSGYALDLAPSYKVNDNLSVGGFMTLVSGDDPESADKDESFMNSTISGTNSGINSWRLYIIEDGGSFTTNSDVAGAGKYSNTAGYNAFGLVLNASFGDFSAKLQGAYVLANKKPSLTDNKKDMGIEIDLNMGYGIAEGATLFVEGAFLKTGDAYKATIAAIQNAVYVNGGISFEL